MGRPLRADLLAQLRLKAVITGGASVTLGKQVGYNKYVAGQSVIKLVDKASANLVAGEGLLVLTDGNSTYNVTKITKRLMYVGKDTDASYAYSLVDGVVVFAKEGVSVATTPCTLTIDPTPADATVTLTSTGATQSGKSITVAPGATVSYEVAKADYNTVTGSKKVFADETLAITLTAV